MVNSRLRRPCGTLNRRLQPFRYLHSCSITFLILPHLSNSADRPFTTTSRCWSAFFCWSGRSTVQIGSSALRRHGECEFWGPVIRCAASACRGVEMRHDLPTPRARVEEGWSRRGQFVRAAIKRVLRFECAGFAVLMPGDWQGRRARPMARDMPISRWRPSLPQSRLIGTPGALL